MALLGIRADVNNRGRGRGAGREQEGITGLRALGVRDMNYRLAFLVCSVTGGSSNVSLSLLHSFAFDDDPP